MSHALRILRMSFESRRELDREYASNLANGGLFIPRHPGLLYGEPVLVFMDLLFAGTSVELEGRVVQTIPPEFEASGGRSGVAIEMTGSAKETRELLEAAISDRFEDDEDAGAGKRASPRSVAHVRARVRVKGGREFEGRTRDLSLGGVLISIGDVAPPVGQTVTVVIVHPNTGEERSIAGIIARHALDEAGGVTAIGIQFSVDPASADETLHYLNQVKSSEHTRRLGGITGSIDTLGLNDLLMSFGQCVPRGRFTLIRSGEIGTVHVENGLMVSAQLGEASGVKALVRMAAWRGGSFEFHANSSRDTESASMQLPIEAALLEAARLLDENRSAPGVGLEPGAELRWRHARVDLEDPVFSSLETKILDLAGSGATVRRLLDRIPEPDAEIERGIVELTERGVLRIDRPQPLGIVENESSTPLTGMPI